MKRNPEKVVSVIEDDESVRRATSRLLRSAGFEVRTFASAQEFLDACCFDEAVCAIVDVMIPGMDGLALQKRMLEDHIQIPVIFLTASDDELIRKKAKDVGAAAFFRKPVDGQALLDAVEWVSRAQTSTE